MRLPKRSASNITNGHFARFFVINTKVKNALIDAGRLVINLLTARRQAIFTASDKCANLISGLAVCEERLR